MAAPGELTSLVSSLEELTKRVTAMAEAARGDQSDDISAELFGVERALQGALRRLRRLESARR
jgi:hypothetical protein